MAIATYPPVNNLTLNPVRNRRHGKRRPGKETADGLSRELTFSSRIKSLSVRNAFKSMFERKSQNEDAGPFPGQNTQDQPGLARAQTTRTSSWVQPNHIQVLERSQEEWISHGFSFPLPTEPSTSDPRESTNTNLTRKKLPPSFSTSHVVQISGVRGRAYAENAEVSYRIIVEWSPLDHSQEPIRRDSFDESKKPK
jgi:hypothetical protein